MRLIIHRSSPSPPGRHNHDASLSNFLSPSRLCTIIPFTGVLLELTCLARDRAGKKLPDAEPASTNNALGEDDFDADAPTEEEMAMLQGVIPFLNKTLRHQAEPSDFLEFNQQCVIEHLILTILTLLEFLMTQLIVLIVEPDTVTRTTVIRRLGNIIMEMGYGLGANKVMSHMYMNND